MDAVQHTRALYLFSSRTSASNNKYSVSNKAARLISIQQILDHKWHIVSKNASSSHVTAESFHFACSLFQFVRCKEVKMSHARKKKSLFPACVFLHFLMNEQNRELISSTDMSVGKSRAVPAILNARVKKCNMIFGQYGIK